MGLVDARLIATWHVRSGDVQILGGGLAAPPTMLPQVIDSTYSMYETSIMLNKVGVNKCFPLSTTSEKLTFPVCVDRHVRNAKLGL